VSRRPVAVRLLLGVPAGTAGTAVLTAAYALERRLRRTSGPLDYDDSDVPGQIVATILHLPSASGREEHELGLGLRWSYGSVFGVAHGLLRRRLPEPQATAAFGGLLMTATLSLFPALGRTPPPWRWPRSFLVTSLLTHAAYAITVGAVHDRLDSASG
jgi:hypothetical protein